MANRIKSCEGTLHLTDTASALQLVADTQEMDINETADSEQETFHGSCAQATLSSSTAYTLSFSGMLSTDDSGQAVVKIGDTVPWTWYLTADHSAAGPAYSGNFVVTGVDRSFPAAGRATFSVSGTGDGDLVKTNVVL